MHRRIAILGVLALVAGSPACSGERQIIPILPDQPMPGVNMAAADPSFQLDARAVGLRDPFPVAGADVAFVDLASSLGEALRRTVKPRPDEVLSVDLVGGDASFHDHRFAVSLVARATLRTRRGHAFLAQKQLVCRDGAVVPPDAGAVVIWSCINQLARDFGGWFEALPPPASLEPS